MSEDIMEEPFIPENDWIPFITYHPNRIRTPSVEHFKHAPLSPIWKDCLKVGIQFNVKKGGETFFEGKKRLYWPAKAIQYKGYFVKLRYVRFKKDPANDFWLHLFSPRLQAMPGSVDSAQAMGAIRLFVENQHWNNQKTLYNVGQLVEIVDRDKLSQIQLAEIKKIQGGRLFIHYIDGRKDPGFWCSTVSDLVHPLGWAKAVGHEIVAPPSYNPPTFDLLQYEREAEGWDIKELMKVEAVDPLRLSQICSATITKVLNGGFVMVRMDCHVEHTNDTDFCYHISSPYVLPSGFCERHGIPLKMPEVKEEISQGEQLPKFVGAPHDKVVAVGHKFKVGMRIEAVDLMMPWWIGPATIKRVIGNLLRIKFDDYETEYDQWMWIHSPDLYPIGYCEYIQRIMPNEDDETKPNTEIPIDESASSERVDNSNLSASSLSREKQAEVLPISNDAAAGPSTTASIQNTEQSSSLYYKKTQYLNNLDCGDDRPITCLTDCEPMYAGLPFNVSGEPYNDSRSLTDPYSIGKPPQIPKFIGDAPVSGTWENADPCSWGPEQVAKFLIINGYEAYSQGFIRNNISGPFLLTFTDPSELMNRIGLEAEIAVHIRDLIDQLAALETLRNIQKPHTSANNDGDAADNHMELDEANISSNEGIFAGPSSCFK